MEGLVSKDLVSGLCAGFINVAFLAPLDTIKTRFMVHGPLLRQYAGLSGALTSILQTEGMKGLYRGSRVSFLAFPASWGVFFAVYAPLKQQHSPTANCMASMVAGVSSIVLTNPLWLIRTRIQLQTECNGKYASVGQAFKLIVKEEGYTPFFKGVAVSLLGVSHIAIQLPVYEWLKSTVCDDNSTFEKVLVCSSTSKIVASLMTYPHEVVRARIFAQNSTISAVFWSILHREGLKGFYSGFIPNLLRIIPSSFITLYTYEVVSQALSY